ncbi:MAG: ABC transporter ATP-binding protein [Planctomycetes bacterium]|nr:ABC transporter ATP-binding protein [Planctomycetota bacterium]
MQTSAVSTPAAIPLLECRGLARTFVVGDTELHVLRGVDFSLYEGEIAGIVGASGAGKSTLLHLLGLLDTPTSGEIFYRGKNLLGMGPEASARVRNKEFGFVFQAFHLLNEFTALENVLMPARIGAGSLSWLSGADTMQRDAIDLLGRVGLGQRLHHTPTRLSGGERQRVALARALINKPAVVFCDEPTGNLDSKTADEIFALIEQFNAERKQTFLIVTHSETLAQRARRRLRMADGRFVE